MIKKLLFCVLTIVVITAKAQVKTTLGFINYYGDDPAITSVSSGIDAGSKIYTAGRAFFSTSDIVIQCTDSTGNVLWTFPYDNGGYDSPTKIRIDALGNCYITGVSENLGITKKDIILIALDANGNLLFPVVRYDHGLGDDDLGNDLVVDANGDIYLTGKVQNGSGSWNAITIKYQAGTGNLLWKDIYPGSGANDIGVCMVLANNQVDVIVGGTTEGIAGSDIVVYQLDAASGSAGWATIIGGTNNLDDNVSSIILSGANVVFAGMVDNSGTDQDFIVAKLNASSGTQVFKKFHDFSSTDYATSVVRDSTGNIGVVGVAMNSGLYEYHTVFYDSLGTPSWTHKKATNCNAVNVNPQITCDTIAHHFYVVGEKQNASRDILVYQLTPGGNIGWERSIDRPLSNSTDVGTSIVVNGIGVLFVSGNTTDGLTGDFDMTTFKLAQTPVYFPPDLGTPEIKDEHFVFQENRGQLLHPNGTPVSPDKVGYYNQGHDPSYYFNNSTISHIVFDKDTIQDTIVRVDLSIQGANSLADVYHYEPVEAKKNYFTTSTQGITDVTSYARLFIPEILPNVDVHHYSNTSGLKSYYVFKVPGESMGFLRLKVDGANSTSVDGDGNLIASTDLGDINMGMLTAYQATFNPMTPSAPVLVPLTASWNSMGSNMYNFSVSGYMPFWPVVVYVSKPGATTAPTAPPIGNLYWSTFIGNQGSEQITTGKVDAKDNYFIAGGTTAANYPTSVGTYLNITNNPSSIQYGILSKFGNDGKALYGTYFGSNSSACGDPFTKVLDLTIDSLYNIYIVGGTNTNNMPIKVKAGAINYGTNAANSGGQCQNAFIAKLNPLGNALHFSSYYGGTGPESFNCIRYKNGNIYLGGNSSSASIPMVSPAANTTQFASGGGLYMRLDTNGVIKHNTKLHNSVVAGDVDNNGNFYMLSNCISASGGVIPPIVTPTGFYSSSYNGNWDWALQRMTVNDSLNWSTPIGGSGSDFASSISIRDSVMAICGSGSSGVSFPFQVAPGDSGDVNYGGGTGFDIQMMKFNLKNGQILWSAYHGTDRNESAKGVILDKSYNMFVTGTILGSSSQSAKLVNATGYYNQPGYIGTDGILLGYSSDNKKKWATFYGSLSNSSTASMHDDAPSNIAVNSNGHIFISGQSNVKNNSLPLVQWNSVCYYDPFIADLYPSFNPDGFIAMFQTSSLFPVGIKENAEAKLVTGMLLFPNPNNGNFSIRFTEQSYESVNISVMNVMGQKVYEKNNLKTEGNEVSLNLKDLSNGIYLINVSNGKGSATLKFVLSD